MKQYGDRDTHIRSNVDELNKYLLSLLKLDPECAKFVIRDLAQAILADLKLNSPVVTGNLRGNWNLTEIANAMAYHIFNNTEYIFYVEYGQAASAGFVRRTLEDWRLKAPEFIRSRIEAWIEKKRREAQ
jgi:hypothetical protein